MRSTLSRAGVLVLGGALAHAAPAAAELNNPNVDWMSGRYGAGFHYLQNWLTETKDGGPAEWNAAVSSFDVQRFADDVARTGAGWVIFTVGQNSGYYCAPNSVINKYSGYAPGERCSTRDLPLAMANALATRNIRLILYLPSNAPKLDAKIANGFGLTTKASDGNWLVNEAFVQKWSEVIREWSLRYGTKVSGWWFDGFYGSRDGFTGAYGRYYSDAAKAGNPKSVIALNGGANRIKKMSDFQDYTAGELGDITKGTCSERWITGIQCGIFTPAGTSWGGGGLKYADAQIVDFTNQNRAVGGGITWNLGVSGNGTVNADKRDQFERIRASIGGGTGSTPTPTPTPTRTPTPSPTPCSTCGFSGYYRLMARHSGKAVVVAGASTADGANVYQWDYNANSTRNDEWELRSIGGGYYRVINRLSGKDMVILNASTANAGDVVQFTYGGSTANDEWQPIDLGNGYYRIVNRNSGKVLNVSGASTTNAANVDQWSWANVTQQQFQIIAVP
jgi:hypothetical protein